MKLTKQQLIDKIGMLPVDDKEMTYKYYSAFQQVKEIILQTEIISDHEPVNHELEEAKNRFSAGSWFTSEAFKSTLHKVKKVERRSNKIRVRDDSDFLHDFTLCTPATLPTRKINWRCMKTDVPSNETYKVLRLRDTVHTGFYNIYEKCWVSYHCCLDVSKYNTALWCELSEIEGE